MITRKPVYMSIANKQRVRVTLFWLVLLISGLGFFLSKGTVTSDVTQFMPDTQQDERLSLLLSELRHGTTSRVFLVRVEGESAEESAHLSRNLKKELVQSNYFDAVNNGQYSYNPELYEDLFPYRYLLVSDARLGKTELSQDLEQRLDEIYGGLGTLVKQTLASDPQNLFYEYLGRTSHHGQPTRHLGVWFDKKKIGALIMVTLKDGDFDLDKRALAMKTIKNTLESISPGRKTGIQITGPASFAVSTRARIQQETRYFALLALPLLVLIFWWGYRSVRLLGLASAVLVSAVIAALVCTQSVFGQVHGIVIVFGITLLGISLDYPVHLFSHIKEGQSAQSALSSIWPTLRLGVFSTALAYVALLGTGFPGLSQLAVFAVSGLTAALVTTRWVLPHWVGQVRQSEIPRLNSKFCSPRCQWALAGLGLIVALSILVLNKNHLWMEDIADISPVPVSARNLDRQLRQELGAPDVNHVFVITDSDRESLLRRTESLTLSIGDLKTQNIASHVFSVTDYLPSATTQKSRQSKLPDRPELRSRLSKALSGKPFKQSTFDDFINDVEASRTLAPLTWDKLVESPLQVRLSQDMFQRDGKWNSIIRLSGVSSLARLHQWLNDHPSASRHYMSIKDSSSQLLSNYRIIAFQRMALGALIILLVLIFVTRPRKKILNIGVPVVLAVLLSIAAQVFLGDRINLFHVLSLLLVVGIGLDYGLFFNRTYRTDEEARRRTHGILISASSTLVTFGLLSLSSIPVLEAMGKTVAIGVATCFIFSFIFSDSTSDAV